MFSWWFIIAMIVFNESVSGKTGECQIPRCGSGFLPDGWSLRLSPRVTNSWEVQEDVTFPAVGSPTIPEEAGRDWSWDLTQVVWFQEEKSFKIFDWRSDFQGSELDLYQKIFLVLRMDRADNICLIGFLNGIDQWCNILLSTSLPKWQYFCNLFIPASQLSVGV